MKIKNKYIIIISVIIVFIIIGALYRKRDDNIIPNNPAVNKDTITESNMIVVDVKGEVNRPGLYYLYSDARVNDAIILAGGFTNEADKRSLNLALKVSDGMLIYVDKISTNEILNKVSINRATLDELMMINGIGETKARNIIEYRNTHGGFKSLEDLKNVSGISESLLEQIKDFICL